MKDGEIKELFATIDADLDTYIDANEWDHFFEIFFDPF